MKWHLARILRRFADRLDSPPKATSWWVDPANYTASSTGSVTVHYTTGRGAP